MIPWLGHCTFSTEVPGTVTYGAENYVTQLRPPAFMNHFAFLSSLPFWILAKAWPSSSGHSDLFFLCEDIPAPFCLVAVTNSQAFSLPLLHLPLLGSCQDLQLTILQGLTPVKSSLCFLLNLFLNSFINKTKPQKRPWFPSNMWYPRWDSEPWLCWVGTLSLFYTSGLLWHFY